MTLILGDCLEVLKTIPDKSIDLVLTDPPYGVTGCKWDTVIPFEPMWKELKRIRKDNAAVVLFGSEPFSSVMRLSNISEFKYDWTWRKKNPSNYLDAKRRPLGTTEQISVFGSGKINYFPQGLKPFGKMQSCPDKTAGRMIGQVGAERIHRVQEFTNYPRTVLEFSKQTGFHTSQKPVALLEYLIKTYTLEGETVLDFTMGSGSTGVACKNIKRSFIGIEQDPNYYDIAVKRISDA